MSNHLNVTLDENTTPWSLDVDQHGHNQVNRSSNAQDIVWHLTGNAATGSFVAQDDPLPGFEWTAPVPPDDIFSTPVPVPGSNNTKLTMSDLNNSDSTAGTWRYVLRATVNGTVYQTIGASITATNNDPCIQNKT